MREKYICPAGSSPVQDWHILINQILKGLIILILQILSIFVKWLKFLLGSHIPDAEKNRQNNDYIFLFNFYVN